MTFRPKGHLLNILQHQFVHSRVTRRGACILEYALLWTIYSELRKSPFWVMVSMHLSLLTTVPIISTDEHLDTWDRGFVWHGTKHSTHLRLLAYINRRRLSRMTERNSLR